MTTWGIVDLVRVRIGIGTGVGRGNRVYRARNGLLLAMAIGVCLVIMRWILGRQRPLQIRWRGVHALGVIGQGWHYYACMRVIA